jgi:hypothetical protein
MYFVTMKRNRLYLLSAILIALTFTGCITHSIFVDLSADNGLEYRIVGDSLDIYDSRVLLPDAYGWEFVAQDIEIDDDQKSVILDYKHDTTKEAFHPFSPTENPGFINSSIKKGFLFSARIFKIGFPSWKVLALYGDPEEFYTDDIRLLNDDGFDDLLTDERRSSLERKRALALRKSSEKRYKKQFMQLIDIWIAKGIDIDREKVLFDGKNLFEISLNEYTSQFDSVTPENVSLEWYTDLREIFADNASEITGEKRAWFLNVADSLEHRYKCWMDLQDDSIELAVVLPGTFQIADADSVSGDTLFWSLNAEYFANSDYEIKAKSYTLQPAGLSTSFVVLLIVVVYVVRRKSRA